MTKYVRVILNSDNNMDEVLKKYNLNKKVDFAFYDLIYVNKNGTSITEDTLKIRVYQINHWKSKNVLVIRKDAPVINGSKEDRVLLREEFDSEEDAIKFVEDNFSNDYDFAFKLQKTGIQYGNELVDLWYEDIEDIGISIELGSEEDKLMEDILSELSVKERLAEALPEYMLKKIKEDETCKK